MRNKKLIIVVLIVIVVIAAVAIIVVGRPSSLPPLTTIFPKDNNRFSISSNVTSGPRLQEGYLDPFTPVIGKTQTLSVKASDGSPIVSLFAVVEMDKTSSTHPLQLVEGDATNGLWRGSWTVSDTADKVYIITISAADRTSSSSVTLSIK
jgi:hypothetical protein